MKYLQYLNYQNGRAGLSNGIMSLECGVALAYLLERVLVFEGNVSPSANLVDHKGHTDTLRKAKLTDLFDVPIEWTDGGQFDGRGLMSRQLTDLPLYRTVFYWPETLDTRAADFIFFTNGRTDYVTARSEDAEIDVLQLMGMDNLSYYSYLFYLPQCVKKRLYRLLGRMRPKKAYIDFAARVSKKLGSFNAVHVRRGDFEFTYGVTMRSRTGRDVVRAIEQYFPKDDPLVICTDASGDIEFFAPVLKEYRDSVFLDFFVWNDSALYRDFRDLAFHDNMSFALITQLVASDSKDFIGSMTSTFTALIQRMRGNKGKREEFKFLWNEVPDPGDRLERGRHRIGSQIPFEKCKYVEEFVGPYSWNRISHRINGGWMREWPESFLPNA